MSLIQRLLDRFYPNKGGYTVIFFGIDYAGKTSLLYFLKQGSLITVIPTVGINVETVKVQISKGQALEFTGWDIGTGCGINHRFGFLRYYIPGANAMIWMVDSTDRERLPESVEAFKRVVPDIDDQLHSENSRRMFPVLILANKADVKGGMTLDEIRLAFANSTKSAPGIVVSVFQTSLKHGILQGGIPEAFDWLSIAMERSKSGKKPTETFKALPDHRSTNLLTEKLVSWLDRAEKDSSPEEFVSQFKTLSLPMWDHYTHIRIAYVILSTFGRQKGKNKIFEGIENYITKSEQTRGRTFHVTMTYFWIQIVHLGIRNVPPVPTSTSNSSEQPESSSPSINDFLRFLLINPHVADGNLWTEYYSKDVMMSPKAKAEMVLPDKRNLPTLVARDAIQTFVK